LLLLAVFCLVNAALIVLQRRPGEPRGAFEVPAVVPLLGVLACGGLIVARLSRLVVDPLNNWRAPAIAGGLVLLIALLYAVVRPRNITEEALRRAEGEM